MKLEQIEIPVTNQLLNDYWSHWEKLNSFFQYEYNDDSFKSRYNYLKNRHYNSSELTNVIRSYMEPYGISEKQEENLQNLHNGAVAIVGGQQAGILTGPLYSVHKAISVILLAKQQSEHLGEKVVPLFWIAGEDHDIEEINHTYTIVNETPKKKVYDVRSRKKTMASATIIQKDQLKELIENIFKSYGETEYTNDLYSMLQRHVDESTTFTQFFTHTMNELFKNEGLLMIDAAYTPFRKYESPFFEKIINHNEEIARRVVEKEALLNATGYGMPINAGIHSANLFYVHEGERFLLERNNGQYQDASGLYKFSENHLLDIAATTPESLSNNVVTRPLMQEMTIPVLAFVGGPGELAYWATLKDAFQCLDLQMPILAPRLNITFVTRKVEQLLLNYDLTISQVLNGKATELKEQFIERVQDIDAKQQIANILDLLEKEYKELGSYLSSQSINLDGIIEKNKQYHQLQLQYLSKKIDQEVLMKHDKALRQFNRINAEIYPNENLQERIYNPFQYLNIYGPTLIKDLCELPLSISNCHFVVHL